ncbi:MAG: hypothetical protein ACREBE_26785, partial [bacterium]
RQSGAEGLCFLALAAHPEAFTKAHDAMAGVVSRQDALLAYVKAVSGGLYFVPPSAEWLSPGVNPVQVPGVAQGLERKQPLILAEVTPATLEYAMSARRLGGFTGSLGNESIAVDLRPIVQALNWLVARQSAANPPDSYDDLTKLLAKALAQANAVNHEAGEYITLDP